MVCYPRVPLQIHTGSSVSQMVCLADGFAGGNGLPGLMVRAAWPGCPGWQG